jgi:hypothetical protein
MDTDTWWRQMSVCRDVSKQLFCFLLNNSDPTEENPNYYMIFSISCAICMVTVAPGKQCSDFEPGLNPHSKYFF